MKNKTLILIISIALAGGAVFMLQPHDSQDSRFQPIKEVARESVSQPTPTPFAFRDLTIPFLREKKYTSSLGDRTVSYETGTYSAYVSSYDSEGLRINGLLTEPKGEMPQGGWPAIIFIHGYIPPQQYRTTQQYYDYVDYLARNGFVVFKIDLRGHDNSEGEASGAYYSTDYVIDALNAQAALQTSSFVHPDKIGLWGHSMAGNIVMRALAADPDIPAIVIWAGAVYTYIDFREYGISDSSYVPPSSTSPNVRRRQQIIETHGEIRTDSPFWKQVAATNYLDDIKGSIQIHHAVNDDVVPIEYSRNLVSILDNTSIKHELHEYESGGHNISGTSFSEAMQRTAEFFKSNL